MATTITAERKHKWTFRSRFRAHGFGWRSATPIKRIKEAVSEIKKVRRKDPALAADGAVMLIERLSPALMNVDSSSGSIGTAVNNAIATLVPLIAQVEVDDTQRDSWLDRLWQAVEDDEMSYIESLIPFWGELCVTPERASIWADRFVPTIKMIWQSSGSDYFDGIYVGLSCLLHAERYQELLDLLELSSRCNWSYRRYGVKALAAMGRKGDALRYAEDSKDDRYAHPQSIALACEEVLLSSGMIDEAYQRYAITANEKNTYIATFRAIAKKYPHKTPEVILSDLVASTPEREGKWFATARSIGLYDEALALVKKSECNHNTLIRAARDTLEERPAFAMETALAAVRWMHHAYEIEYHELSSAVDYALQAAEKIDRVEDVLAFFQRVIEMESGNEWIQTQLKQMLKIKRILDITPKRESPPDHNGFTHT